jgi:hypothetical protein
MKIYLTGYRGKKIDALNALAISLHAVICDIRYKPWSPQPSFQPAGMKAVLGVRYHWLKGFGNTKFKEGGIELQNYAQGVSGLESLQAQGYEAAILLCACDDAPTCHRTTVGRMLTADGWDVEELDWQGMTAEKGLF